MSNKGKEAEDKIHKLLQKFSNKGKRFHILRLYDSYSTGGYTGARGIPAQPSDFLIIRKDPFIEIKSTIDENCWTIDNISTSQWKFINLLIPQGRSYFVLLVCSSVDKMFLLSGQWLLTRLAGNLPKTVHFKNLTEFEHQDIESILKEMEC